MGNWKDKLESIIADVGGDSVIAEVLDMENTKVMDYFDISDVVDYWNSDDFIDYLSNHYSTEFEDHCPECEKDSLEESSYLDIGRKVGVEVKNIPDEDRLENCLKIYKKLNNKQVEELLEKIEN